MQTFSQKLINMKLGKWSAFSMVAVSCAFIGIVGIDPRNSGIAFNYGILTIITMVLIVGFLLSVYFKGRVK